MNILTDEEIFRCVPQEEDMMEFARAIEAAVLAKLAALDVEPVEPVAWWVPKAEQFAIMDKPKTRPFAKAFEPLYSKAQLLAVQQRNMDGDRLHTENEALRKDAKRYKTLANYIVSTDTLRDDDIVACSSVAELSEVLDSMKGQ